MHIDFEKSINIIVEVMLVYMRSYATCNVTSKTYSSLFHLDYLMLEYKQQLQTIVLKIALSTRHVKNGFDEFKRSMCTSKEIVDQFW